MGGLPLAWLCLAGVLVSLPCTANDVVSRSFRVFAGDIEPAMPTEAMAPAFSVFAGDIDPQPFTEAHARAFTVQAPQPLVNVTIDGPSLAVTTTGPVDYIIRYTNAATVTLSPSDISAQITGTVTGNFSVLGSGLEERTVRLSNLAGEGTVAIVVAPGTATSPGGEPAPGAGPSIPVTVDSVPPTATVAPLQTIDPQPELMGGVDDADAVVTVTVDGQSHPAINNGDGTWTLPQGIVGPLDSGVYDVAVSAADLAGNVGMDATVDELTVFKPGRLQGSVVLGGTELPVTCAAVYAESLEYPFDDITATDLNGGYRLPALFPGLYLVSVHAPGFEPDSIVIEVEEGKLHGHNFHLLLRPGAVFGSSAASPGTIRGFVFDEDNDEPLVGVLATATIDAAVVDTTFTCADGTFEVVIESAKGILDVNLGFELTNYDPENRSVEFNPDAGTELDPVGMKGQLIPTTTLAGTVSTSGTGTPINAARITVLGPVKSTTQSESNGAYVLVLPPGAYRIEASASGHAGAQTNRSVSGTTSTWNPQLRAVPKPVELRDVDGDGDIDAIDVQLVINAVLGLPTLFDADVNGDGVLDALDVQSAILGALGIEPNT